jgi:hypothetical protein
MKTARLKLPRTAASLIAIAVAISPARHAAAQAPSASEASDRADLLLNEGIALANQSKWQEAKDKLDEAFRLKKSYDIAGNLALVEDELGEHAAAANHLDFAIRTFPASGKPEHRQTLRDQMDKVQKSVASIRFRISEPGSRVTVDGTPVDPDILESGVYVEPGARAVLVTKEGFEDFKSTETIGADAYVLVTVQLQKRKADDGGGGGTPPPASEKPLWPAFVLGGLSAVGVGVGIAGVVVAAGKDADADELAQGASCKPITTACVTDGQTLADDRGLFNTVGVVGWVVGGTALAGMVTYLLIPGADTAPVKVDASLSPAGSWVGATLHF